MITLTDWDTHEPVMLNSKEISAIKVDPKTRKTYIYVDTYMIVHPFIVCESPEQIGEAIMAPLLVAGEQIRI